VARVGGRNSVLAWIAGIFCAAVVGALVVLAVPAVPAAVTLVGETLRGADAIPSFARAGSDGTVATKTPECQAIYSDALWSQLTQRAGGDPVQDRSAPPTTVTSLSTALASTVRVTCAFTGVNTGRIVTSVSEVGPGAASVARAALEVAGFGCAPYGDGVRCSRTEDGVVEENVIRDGIWVCSVFEGWRPDRYIERIATRLWPA